MIEDDKNVNACQTDKQEGEVKENIFSTEEIEIEEMAIDGICGVY
ncbi:MAG: variant-type mycofactocin precursor [Desulfobacteraceae bacterium]|jgi:mycofactocin precursor|nr:variant-type mycofactocin precursor [Desulfobacteraceae bacterium]